MTTEDELRHIPFFAELDTATLANVRQRVRRCSFRPGQHIMTEGEQPDGLYFVLNGRVRLSCTASDGREQVLEMVGPGQTFNAVPIFDHQPNHTTAIAKSPVECLRLPQRDLFDLIRQHPDLALAALNEMAVRLRELTALVEDLAFRSVRERLARQLLAEATEGTAELTHQELAERTGTVREIAGRALRRFAEQRLIRLARGRIMVLDPEGLARIVQK